MVHLLHPQQDSERWNCAGVHAKDRVWEQGLKARCVEQLLPLGQVLCAAYYDGQTEGLPTAAQCAVGTCL